MNIDELLLVGGMIEKDHPEQWHDLWLSRKPNEGGHIRFELGGEDFDNTKQPVPRFIQAYNRAVTVAEHIFEGDLIGIVAWHPEDAMPSIGMPKVKSGFEVLEKTGFSAIQLSQWKADVYPEPGEEQIGFEMRSYDLSDDKINRDCLIWHAVAFEMPIYPSAGVLSWLLDPNSGLMLHVYDDRGMDVMAENTSRLKPIYDRFDPWLLDYDRDRMSKMF